MRLVLRRKSDQRILQESLFRTYALTAEGTGSENYRWSHSCRCNSRQPADKAGIKSSDIIVNVSGKVVENANTVA
jgi:hypothetical protein